MVVMCKTEVQFSPLLPEIARASTSFKSSHKVFSFHTLSGLAFKLQHLSKPSLLLTKSHVLASRSFSGDEVLLLNNNIVQSPVITQFWLKGSTNNIFWSFVYQIFPLFVPDSSNVSTYFYSFVTSVY